MSRLPAPSAATAHVSRFAPVARPPLSAGPILAPVPAGVVSWSFAATRRTAGPSATSRLLSCLLTPHGASATLVALPGPPTPPATVVMVPGAVAAVSCGAAAARPGPLASAVPSASTAAAPLNKIRADVVCPLITPGFIRYPLRLCVPDYR